MRMEVQTTRPLHDTTEVKSTQKQARAKIAAQESELRALRAGRPVNAVRVAAAHEPAAAAGGGLFDVRGAARLRIWWLGRCVCIRHTRKC